MNFHGVGQLTTFGSSSDVEAARMSGAPKKEIATKSEPIDYKSLEFIRKIGSGANGTVYRGIYEDTKVAIKVMDTTDQPGMALKKELPVHRLY